MVTMNFIMCYHCSFRMLGDEWTVKPEVMTALESFTCVMYGQPKEKYINVVRGKLLRNMVGENEALTIKSKVDLSKLPPCKDNLVPHINRVNHRIAHFKRADQPSFWHPAPTDREQGWEKTKNGLEPIWSCRPILPPSLVDLVEKTAEEIDEDDPDLEIDHDLLYDDELHNEDTVY